MRVLHCLNPCSISYQKICCCFFFGTADSDYNFTPLNLTLNSTLSNGTQLFNVSILDDLQLEDNETFVIIVMSAPNTPTTVRVANPEILVAIIDNDGKLACIPCSQDLHNNTLSQR